MSKTIVRTVRGLKSPHKVAILQEASKLNGSSASTGSIQALCRFAEEQLGVSVQPLVVRRLLGGQTKNGYKGPPICKRRNKSSFRF